MKKLLLGSTRLFRGYRDDAEGATAITFALGLTAMLLAMGTGIDFAMVSKKQAQAQDLADRVGLSAAVYVKNNTIGSSPKNKDEGLMDGVVYKVSEIGDERFKIGDSDATVVVDYEPDEAVVTVQGSVPTTFMSLAGIQKTDYAAKAVIKYHQTGVKPASVMLVLDNSGSMQWMDTPLEIDVNNNISTPAGSQRRIDGLRNATRTLNTAISGLAPSNELNDVVRMAMIPYDSDTIDSGRHRFAWGTIPNGKIQSMRPGGLTNSAPPMEAAVTELALEDAAHLQKSNANPLKFAIFMTDGVNTIFTTEAFIPRVGGPIWEAEVCDKYRGTFCLKEYFAADTQPSGTQYDGDWWVGDTTWTQGDYRNDTDSGTLSSCTALKNSGVEVFAVGFATQAGFYESSRNGNGQINGISQVSELDSARIHSFLRQCASSTENYMIADSSLTLNAVFQKIGQTIQKRAIYVAR